MADVTWKYKELHKTLAERILYILVDCFSPTRNVVRTIINVLEILKYLYADVIIKKTFIAEHVCYYTDRT